MEIQRRILLKFDLWSRLRTAVQPSMHSASIDVRRLRWRFVDVVGRGSIEPGVLEIASPSPRILSSRQVPAIAENIRE